MVGWLVGWLCSSQMQSCRRADAGGQGSRQMKDRICRGDVQGRCVGQRYLAGALRAHTCHTHLVLLSGDEVTGGPLTRAAQQHDDGSLGVTIHQLLACVFSWSGGVLWHSMEQ